MARRELEKGDAFSAVKSQESAWEVMNPMRARARRSRLFKWDQAVEAQVRN
jgi:hypothetical protein